MSCTKLALLQLVPACLVAACGDDGGYKLGPMSPPPGDLVGSSVERITSPVVDPGTLAAVVRDNTNAALDLFRRGAGPRESFVFSPLSLTLPLAMTYEGARGATEAQMAAALRFSTPKSELHAALDAIDQVLDARAGDSVHLRIVNALFGARGFAFNQPFVDTTAGYYGGALSRLDFAGDPEAARLAINQWVASETEGEVEELLPPSSITAMTVLALTNAVRFQASWAHPFVAGDTANWPFTRLDGSMTELPMMGVKAELASASTPDAEVLELLYEGDDFSMLIVMPPREKFDDFLASVDAAKLAALASALSVGTIGVGMPKLDLRSTFRPQAALQDLGMVDAFTSGTADLSAIGGIPGELFVTSIDHQAIVKIDENGTKAAAGSAVVIGRKSAVRYTRIDHPFLFFIRERSTGVVLFAGRFVG